MFYIRRRALEFLLGASRSLHPREFIGFLRAEGNVITEVIVLPGSVYGEGFASSMEHMRPADKSILGSVHSHPSSNNRPSENDLLFFGKKGGVNLIVRYPYQGIGDVSAYDGSGAVVEVEVLD